MAYVKWTIIVPSNTNFSFERDSDLDGVADDWIGDPFYCNIISEQGYPHAQEINNSLIVYSNLGIGVKIQICCFYKFLVTGHPKHFYIRMPSLGYNRKIERESGYDGFEWKFFYEEITVTPSPTTSLSVDSQNAHIAIEHLAVNNTQNIYDFLVNPEFFTGEWEYTQDRIRTVNDLEFRVSPIKYKHHLRRATALFTCSDREHLEFLKSLNGEKILIRTHDENIWAMRVTAVSKDYHEGRLGACQTYDINVELEAI